MERVIDIGGREYRMRASALIPRLYRFKFGRDIIMDLNELKKSFERVKGNSEERLTVLDLTIFENIAWLFCRHGDPENVPDDPDEWLESIDGVFSIYEVLPQVLQLWADANKTTSAPRKK